MRCHYEVMCLPREATAEDIKKQYRKLALQWHPDRNHGQEELAAQTFKEISSAYTVLSDPQERAWYDNHREAILRGSDGTSGEDVDVDYTPNLFKYFSTSCFAEFDDNEKGFYTVYSSVFETIAEVEEARGTAKMASFVPFGSSSSEDADVYTFYNNWENFITTISFAWEDKYNILEAPNRQVKRAMEKENSKLRDVARREYINLVRSLVAYVKKRDQRIAVFETERKRQKDEEQERRLEAKKIEKERKRLEMERWRETAEDDAAVREEERKRAFLLADNDSDYDDEGNNGGYNEHDLNRLAQSETLLEDLAANASGTVFNMSGIVDETADRDGGADNLEEVDEKESGRGGTEEALYSCDICAKGYRTEMQLTQHLASKIHRKKVQEATKKSKSKGKGKVAASADA